MTNTIPQVRLLGSTSPGPPRRHHPIHLLRPIRHDTTRDEFHVIQEHHTIQELHVIQEHHTIQELHVIQEHHTIQELYVIQEHHTIQELHVIQEHHTIQEQQMLKKMNLCGCVISMSRLVGDGWNLCGMIRVVGTSPC